MLPPAFLLPVGDFTVPITARDCPVDPPPVTQVSCTTLNASSSVRSGPRGQTGVGAVFHLSTLVISLAGMLVMGLVVGAAFLLSTLVMSV